MTEVAWGRDAPVTLQLPVRGSNGRSRLPYVHTSPSPRGGGLMKEPTAMTDAKANLRAAIDAKCRECIYDPGSAGSWRVQVADCCSSNCPLHALRPMPRVTAS